MTKTPARKPFDVSSSVKSLAGKLDELKPGEKVLDLAVKDIIPDPDQPRRHIDQKKAEMLGESIKTTGQQQPIIVRANPGKGPPFMILSGERRWTGCKLVGLKTIKAIVRVVTDEQAAEILAGQMAENLGQEPMDFPDQVAGIARMRKFYSAGEVAARSSKPNSWVSKMSAIAAAGGAVANAVESGYLEDVETLYDLARVQKKDPGKADRIVATWSDESKRTFARQQVRTALAAVEGKEEPKSNPSTASSTAKNVEPADAATPTASRSSSPRGADTRDNEAAGFSHAKMSGAAIKKLPLVTVESAQVLADRVVLTTSSGTIAFDRSLLTALDIPS